MSVLLTAMLNATQNIFINMQIKIVSYTSTFPTECNDLSFISIEQQLEKL